MNKNKGLYLINHKKLGKYFKTPSECIDTMYDEFRLNASMYKGKIKVLTHSDNAVKKLEKFLKKYDADKEYIEEVFKVDESLSEKRKQAILEAKNNENNMSKNKLSLNADVTNKRPSLNAVSESAKRPSLNSAINESWEDGDDEDLKDALYLISDYLNAQDDPVEAALDMLADYFDADAVMDACDAMGNDGAFEDLDVAPAAEDDVTEPLEDTDESYEDDYRYIDRMVEGYKVENNHPTHDQLRDMMLEAKSYVMKKDGKFNGQLFCDLVGHITHDKFGIYGLKESEEYKDLVCKAMFSALPLNETKAYFKVGEKVDESEKVDEAEKAPKSEVGNKGIDGKKLKEYKLAELKDLLLKKKEELKDAKKAVRLEKDEKKAAKLQKAVDKIQAEIDMINQEIKFRKANKMNESSVRNRFNQYSKVFESDEAEKTNECGDISEDDEEKDDDAEVEEKPADEPEEKKEEKKDDVEDTPMTAVLVKVAKDDVEKAKKQMIDAGVEEDDIDVVEGDEDDDEVEIKVDANSIMALKDWLDTKGIDLEEKLGGEIVPPDETEDDKDDKDEDGNDAADAADAETEDPDLDNMSFDDIFGGDEE